MVERIVERAAGLDVHKDVIVAEAHLPAGWWNRAGSPPPRQDCWRCGIGWLPWGHSVGIESTGVFWKSLYYVLEDVMEVLAAQRPAHAKIPGRKTDVSRLGVDRRVDRVRTGPAGFVPPPRIRQLRDLTRYRTAPIQDRTREVQRLEKILEDAGIKLDLCGQRHHRQVRRAMLAALMAGHPDPRVLADLARGRMRTKIPALREALQSRFGAPPRG